jgi:lipoprotein-anchoring transpeptidase ErfK/SrfK
MHLSQESVMDDRNLIERTAAAALGASQGVAHPRLNWRRLAVALLLVVLIAVPASALAAPQGDSYVVQQGDTLANIAARMGVSMRALAEANGIPNVNLIYAGQVLAAPGASASATTRTHSTTRSRGYGPAWIDIDLSEQWLTAYEGDTPVFGAAVSTGIDGYNTPVGQFAIEWMLEWETMEGADYYLPDVPYVMYFADYLAIHGTYWHDNFGYPMSHGCVNLTISAAGWLYNWVSIGTPIWIHY